MLTVTIKMALDLNLPIMLLKLLVNKINKYNCCPFCVFLSHKNAIMFNHLNSVGKEYKY